MDIPLDELYQEIILEHFRRPRNFVSELPPGTQVHADNPSCGDELELSLRLDGAGERITGVSWRGQGCSIFQASASMMSQAVRGLTPSQAGRMIEQVRAMMHGEPPADELADVAALEGVSRLPMRVKCALLAWLALGDALVQAGSSSSASVASAGGSP